MTTLLWIALLASRLVLGDTLSSGTIEYFTKFGDQVLSRSPQIVRGRIASVSTAPRSEVVRVEVAVTFKGQQVQELVLLANPGEYFAGSDFLLFLEPFEEGPRYTCFNRISSTDPDYAIKERYLQQQLELEALPDPELRRDRARTLLVEHARSPESWLRWNMLRELAYVLDRYPGLVRTTESDGLHKAAEQSSDDEFRKELLILLDRRH
jgi:hypothetical protein